MGQASVGMRFRERREKRTWRKLEIVVDMIAENKAEEGRRMKVGRREEGGGKNNKNSRIRKQHNKNKIKKQDYKN